MHRRGDLMGGSQWASGTGALGKEQCARNQSISALPDNVGVLSTTR